MRVGEVALTRVEDAVGEVGGAERSAHPRLNATDAQHSSPCAVLSPQPVLDHVVLPDRKSTRLNSSH